MRTLLLLALTASASAGSGSMIPEIPAGFTPGSLPATTGRSMPATTQALPGTAEVDRAAARRGLTWLLAHQAPDGGWAAGGWGGEGSRSDVATTAYVLQALRRNAAGAEAAERGIDFVLRAVEQAPDGPGLATPQGTQPQAKLGSLVDTFYAAALLGDLLGEGGLPAHLRARADRAHDVLIRKIERAQADDGSFSRDGWAPVLATSVAMEALNDAKRLGKAVDAQVMSRADQYNGALASPTGVDTRGAAGVPLYATAGALAANDAAVARAEREGWAGSAPAQKAREAAARTRAEVGGPAVDALIAGFGSAGGEEMLSYQLVSDTLAREGGEPWRAWNSKIGSYLRETQNADGSWAGHHCITSAVFVTAGAVMTLSAGGQGTPRG